MGRRDICVLGGAGLCVLYTILITGADAITKVFAAQYAAPQLFALSGGLVAVFCLLVGSHAHSPRELLRTGCPWAMAVRSAATVIGTCAFFYAFRYLPFAEVFVFIGLIPILAAVLSRFVLNERAGAQGWGALFIGLLGMVCLFPHGLNTAGKGDLFAALAVAMGAVSIVASRYISTRNGGSLLGQVFYPNLALMVVMAGALPFVFKPMAISDIITVLFYAILLFAARWVLVGALRLIPAFVVTPLINLQFVWMVAVGAFVFEERSGWDVFAGAALISLAGLWLLRDQMRPSAAKPAVPAE